MILVAKNEADAVLYVNVTNSYVLMSSVAWSRHVVVVFKHPVAPVYTS